MTQRRKRHPRVAAHRDPVRLEVFHHLFAALAEEMGVSLKHSSKPVLQSLLKESAMQLGFALPKASIP